MSGPYFVNNNSCNEDPVAQSFSALASDFMPLNLFFSRRAESPDPTESWLVLSPVALGLFSTECDETEMTGPGSSRLTTAGVLSSILISGSRAESGTENNTTAEYYGLSCNGTLICCHSMSE